MPAIFSQGLPDQFRVCVRATLFALKKKGRHAPLLFYLSCLTTV